MAQLSNYEKAGRVVNDGRFINRLRASVVYYATTNNQPVLSRQDLIPAFAWAVAVGLISSYADSIVDGSEEEIAASVENAIGEISDSQIDSAVADSWETVVGAPAEPVYSTQERLARLAVDQGFQNRVYQIIAAKANGVLAQQPIAAGEPGYDANRIQRGFAMRLQAGLYLTPIFKQNFATNVLGAIGDPDLVSDAVLSSTIDSLLGLFILSRLELISQGKTLENVIT